MDCLFWSVFKNNNPEFMIGIDLTIRDKTISGSLANGNVQILANKLVGKKLPNVEKFIFAGTIGIAMK